MQYFTIIFHTSSGPCVGMPVSVNALPDALRDAGFVLGAGERLEVVPAPRDARATEVVDGTASWWRIPV